MTEPSTHPAAASAVTTCGRLAGFTDTVPDDEQTGAAL